MLAMIIRDLSVVTIFLLLGQGEYVEKISDELTMCSISWILDLKVEKIVIWGIYFRKKRETHLNVLETMRLEMVVPFQLHLGWDDFALVWSCFTWLRNCDMSMSYTWAALPFFLILDFVVCHETFRISPECGVSFCSRYAIGYSNAHVVDSLIVQLGWKWLWLSPYLWLVYCHL